MAVPYRQILRMAARRINAVTGVTAATLETAYLVNPLTSTQIGNTDFTISMIIDNMISVVGTIVRAYASTPDHPYRAFNTSQTSNIANGAALPSVNSASKPIVGVYGAIRDASSPNAILTKQPSQLIDSILVGIADGSLKGTYYYYDIFEGRLKHTVTNAVIDVCTFDITTELAAVAAGNAPIPDACLDLAWTGLVASLMLDDEFVNQASAYAAYFEAQIAAIKSGVASVAPAPQAMASAAPVIS